MLLGHGPLCTRASVSLGFRLSSSPNPSLCPCPEKATSLVKRAGRSSKTHVELQRTVKSQGGWWGCRAGSGDGFTERMTLALSLCLCGFLTLSLMILDSGVYLHFSSVFIWPTPLQDFVGNSSSRSGGALRGYLPAWEGRGRKAGQQPSPPACCTPVFLTSFGHTLVVSPSRVPAQLWRQVESPFLLFPTASGIDLSRRCPQGAHLRNALGSGLCLGSGYVFSEEIGTAVHGHCLLLVLPNSIHSSASHQRDLRMIFSCWFHIAFWIPSGFLHITSRPFWLCLLHIPHCPWLHPEFCDCVLGASCALPPLRLCPWTYCFHPRMRYRPVSTLHVSQHPSWYLLLQESLSLK